jgi:hypothetical protein
VPKLPPTSLSDPAIVSSGCITGPGGIVGAPTTSYPVPPNRGVPKQEPGRPKRRPRRARPAANDERHWPRHRNGDPDHDRDER